jgi:hypothetical protein
VSEIEPRAESDRPPRGPRPPAPPATGEPGDGPDPADPGPPIEVRLGTMLVGDLGNRRTDARVLQAILLRDGIVAAWLRGRGIDASDVDEAFPGSGW